MEFKDVIQNRYSCKDFSTQQIEKEKVCHRRGRMRNGKGFSRFYLFLVLE